MDKHNRHSYNNELRRVEEEEKQRLFNTEEGFVNCFQETTLYNPVSDVCNICNFIEDCKKILKINYEKLYKIREL